MRIGLGGIFGKFSTALLPAIAAALIATSGPITQAGAATHAHHLKKPAAAAWVAPLLCTLVVDADTGKVIESANADTQHQPASLTKMMTLYLLFDAMDAGKVRLTDQITMSRHAASMAPTKINLAPGHSMSVEDAIDSVVTRSANDAAVAIGEFVGGTEPAFAAMMTAKAHQLGMVHTNFANASGLPNKQNTSTARDLSILARALIHNHARQYHFFSVTEFNFQGQVVTGHNHLTENYEGADGLKTGFVNASGFNIVTSAKRGGHRLVGVVLGGPTANQRDRTMVSLLDSSFSQYEEGAPSEALVASATPAPVAPAKAQVAVAAPVAAPAVISPAVAAVPVAAHASVHAKPKKKVIVTAAVVERPASRPNLHIAAALPSSEWVVQLGAYKGSDRAREVAEHARHSLGKVGEDAQVAVEKVRNGKAVLFRARLVGLSQRQARQACHVIEGHSGACAVVGTAQTVASR